MGYRIYIRSASFATLILSLIFSLFLLSCFSASRPLAPISVVDSSYDKATAVTLSILSGIAYGKTIDSAMISMEMEMQPMDANAPATLMLPNPRYMNAYYTIKATIEKNLQAYPETQGYTLAFLGVSRGGLLKADANVVFVVTRGTEAVVVVRGTVLNIMNIQQDLDVLHTKPWISSAAKNARISHGVMNALQATLTAPSYLSPSPMALMDFLSGRLSHGSSTVLYFTGHSLGAAITSAIALHSYETFLPFIRKQKLLGIHTYAIASQTVGNAAYARYYDSLIGDVFHYFRITNQHDVVPLAFSQLRDVVDNGFPYTAKGRLVINTTAVALARAVSSIGYTHSGTLVQLSVPSVMPQTCPVTVNDVKDFLCFELFYHGITHYTQWIRQQLPEG